MLRRITVSGLIGAALMLSTQFANAQIAGQVAPLPAAAIAAFQANPKQLLSQFPNGGPEMIKQTRDLLISDRNTLNPIIAQAKTADQDQRTAMAQALAQAAKTYVTNGDPAFADQIQQTVASSGIAEFAKAYAEAAGDTGTAATGGGGGGGGPNTAGAPIGGLNSGVFITGNSGVPNLFSNLLTGGALGSANGSGTSPGGGTSTTITVNQVSSF
jgi:hypothetical protein